MERNEPYSRKFLDKVDALTSLGACKPFAKLLVLMLRFLLSLARNSFEGHDFSAQNVLHIEVSAVPTLVTNKRN